ncbi:hypothetical protein AURDEDRAFT_86696 [Auricularia subglabra TFB-10046 SS5]|nr:hypothetical protein AURDEDRAFT_86696 [Auricularia subglabra TFB-10046 SS5]
MSCKTPPFPLPDTVDPWVTETLAKGVFKDNLGPLDAAIRSSLRFNVPEMRDWGVSDSRTFLLFASGMLKWVPSEICNGTLVYYGMCLVCFVMGQPPLDGPDFTTPIDPSSVGQPLAPLSRWFSDFCVRIGEWMGTPTSITADAVRTFQASPRYNLDEALVPPGGWRTFNELFARSLKPGMRPVSAAGRDDPNYDRLAVHPADGIFAGAWPVDGGGEIVVKGLRWRIADLLAGSQYADRFAGGVWVHSLLDVWDYHRQHAPVGGTVVEASVTPGLCVMAITADPETGELQQQRSIRSPGEEPGGKGSHLRGGDTGNGANVGLFDSPDTVGYQFLQSRGCVIIKNEFLGYVAVLPIGMGQVSSVKLAWEPPPGGSYPITPMATVNKGDYISHFEFGGSDVVIVFQKDAQMQILGALGADAQGNHTNKQKYMMGMPLGLSSKVPSSGRKGWFPFL